MARLVVFILAVLLASCSAPFYFNIQKYSVNSGDLDASWAFVATQHYIKGDYDELKSPREFFRDGGGDCFDFASALMYLVGPQASLVEIMTPTGKHAIIRYHDLLIDPQVYNLFSDPASITIINEFSYDDVMELVTNYGSKGIKGDQ